MTKNLSIALIVLGLAGPACASESALSSPATPHASFAQSQTPVSLIGETTEAAMHEEIDSLASMTRILDNLHSVRTGGIDQQADQDVFDALASAIDTIPSSKDFLEKRDNAALVAFYKERNFRTAWFENGELTPSARKLAFALSRADRDGLDPADFTTPALTVSRTRGSKPADIAASDIELSRAITRYTRQAYAGRVDPRIFSKKVVTIKPHYPDSIEALKKITRAKNPRVVMRGYNPDHPGFVALRKEYNRLRLTKSDTTTPDVPEGRSMKVGMRDTRVALLRKKLDLPVPAENADLYSKALSQKVKDYQAANGLIADGIAGKATLAVLNKNPADLIPDIIANMERWRWLPRDLGKFHIMVNIPSFHVEVVNNGKKIHETRVVVGKSRHKTPIFSDEMEYVVVNPYWNVPRSIATKELLPQIKSDPGSFFSKRNYQVLASVKGRTRVVDPYKLDWEKVEPGMVRLRQTPGTRNALGNVKFLFPNQHAVYLHDTPSRSLFNRDYRAFSHGCVRVQNPMDFADVILSRTEKWGAGRLKSMIGGDEKWVSLSHKVPVHIVYFTTWMAENGTLQLRSDIYGHNAKVKKALGL
ncbi:murein L,D-transpeptidase [Cohaesibacter sp. ES.047]|uniref:L,D-transpeptidase family protein n=1 Tax=Cohaesibacter sp. ES.047 TaxID=1798205 RepID=UPI00155FEAF8|nr:L,D-transpeptidase family protein [Cohaesibacter sp. ES.047]